MAFRFRLEKVARFRRRIVDAKSRDVATANRVVAALESRLAELRGGIAAAQAGSAPAAGDVLLVSQMAGRTTWTAHLGALCATVEGQLAEARQELAARRDELNSAWRDLEVLEKLRTRQQAAWRDEQHRREVQELDETGQIRADRQRRSKVAT